MTSKILTAEAIREHDKLLGAILNRLEQASTYYARIAQAFDDDVSPNPTMGPAHLHFAMVMGDLADSLEELDLSSYTLPSPA